MRPRFLNPRIPSLIRGSLLVFLSLAAAFVLSDFPNNRPTLLLLIPTLLSIAGMVDTARCMQPRWSFYHGAVLLCICTDLMATIMIFFFLLYPYMSWLTSSE